MTSVPLAIDGFGCAGGAARGWHEAGFDVHGIELYPSANYPYPQTAGDALDELPLLVAQERRRGRRIIHVHVSPPCQGQIAITAGNRGREGWEDDHVNLLPDARTMLRYLRDRYEVTTTMENGPSKHIRSDVRLCGLMFDLPTFRHRDFEVDGFVTRAAPVHPTHQGHRTIGWRHGCLATTDGTLCPKCGIWHRGTVYGVYGKGGGKPTVAEAQRALGIYHTDVIEELNEAIPPAYTRYLGRQILAQVAA